MNTKNKTNIFFMGDEICYNPITKIYKSDDCILKENFLNTEKVSKDNIIKKESFDNDINMDFERNEYFKVNTDILPYSDIMYPCYINNIYVDSAEEIEVDEEIVLTIEPKSIGAILACYQTKTKYGAYITVMKYNYFRMLKDLNCELWAPFDLRKPFKLVQKNNLININLKKEVFEKDISSRIIGEIKQEWTYWHVFHPKQLEITLENIEKEKQQIKSIKEELLRHKKLFYFKQEMQKLKYYFFRKTDGELSMYLDRFQKFW